jgi:transposase
MSVQANSSSLWKVRAVEATGLYSLDLALALHAATGIEVAVLNPKMVNRFAATLCRSKTDPADAQVLAEYARRMPFQAWHPPNSRLIPLIRGNLRQKSKKPAKHGGLSQILKNYFTAATRALRRDLYREPVFLWIMPFFTALSIMETVPEKASLAALESPVAMLSRSLRSAVRRREVLERLSSVRLVVWRARFSAEK